MCTGKYRDGLKVVTFKAPEGSKRKIVFDYYMKMATYPWTPAEDFCITWAPGEEKRYDLALEHKKGKTYYVKVRAYKTVNGTKLYGEYSASKKVKLS